MQEQNNKTQMDELLEMVSFIKDHAASQESVDALSLKVESIETRLDRRIDSLETKVDSLASKMVTKEYLDDKMADLRGDLVVLTRKEDMKVRALIEVMEKKKLLSKEEVKKILSMEPFPQLAL